MLGQPAIVCRKTFGKTSGCTVRCDGVWERNLNCASTDVAIRLMSGVQSRLESSSASHSDPSRRLSRTGPECEER